MASYGSIDLSTVDRKGRSDFVSEVDRQVETILTAAIIHIFPPIG